MNLIFTVLRLLFLIFGLVPSLAFAQQPMSNFNYLLSGNMISSFDNRYEGIQGEFTLFENFYTGVIEFKNGNNVGNVLINYDAVSDQVLVKLPQSESVIVVKKNLVSKFSVTDSQSKYTFESQSIKGKELFLLKLSDGKEKFYCRVSKYIRKADPTGGFKPSTDRYDEIISENTYFRVDENNILIPFEINKKLLINAFPELESQINDYFKRERELLNNPLHLKRMFDFIFGL